MKIEKEKYVIIDYVLKNDRGEIIDSSENGNPMGYIHGMGSLIIGLENALEGKTAGSEISVTIPPESAYGLKSEDLIEEVPLQDLQGIQNLHEGMQLQAETHHGVQIYTVTRINENSVTMDGNHPLAGENLHFHVKINEVRNATEEEIANLTHKCCGGHDHHDHEHGSHGCEHGACTC